jgi:hypothetical protein
LDHIFTHIDAPLLKYVSIKIFNRLIFDVSRIAPFIGRTETFDSLNQAYIYFYHAVVEVVLSSRKAIPGDKMLKLSFKWNGSAWELRCLTQSCRHPDFESFDLCGLEETSLPLWAERMEDAPWLELVRFFTAMEYMYLSRGLAVCIPPALQGLTGEGITGVLPVLRNIFIEQLDALGALRQAIGEFVAARQLLSGHLIGVQSWARGERIDSSGG